MGAGSSAVTIDGAIARTAICAAIIRRRNIMINSLYNMHGLIARLKMLANIRIHNKEVVVEHLDSFGNLL